MIKIDPTDYKLSWTKEIVEKRVSEWITNSEPELYTRKENNVMMIVFRNEGIIYKRLINN